MDIKTFIAAAVVALTAACSQEAPAPAATESVVSDADAAATEAATEAPADIEATNK